MLYGTLNNMDISLPISSILIIAIDSVGIILSLSLSTILLTKKGKRHLSVSLFGLLLLLTGLTLLNDMLTTSGISNQFQELYFLPLFYSLSIGPLFYLLVKSKNQIAFKWYDYLHLILPFVQAIVYFAIGFRSIEFKSSLWENSSFPLYLKIESFLFSFSILTYGVLSRFLLKKGSNKNYFWTKDLKQWLLKFTNGFLLIAIIELCFSIEEYFFNYPFGEIVLVLRSCTLVTFVLWISFHGIKQYFPTEIFHSKPKLSKSLIDETSLATYKQQLTKLLQEEKVYLNPDLNLKLLAQYLQVSEKICSNVLSQGLNSNFNQVINSYRIEAFKNKIHNGEHREYTLTSIAYDCGFDSKSTFNRAFKFATNMPPSQFVKSLEII